MTARTKASRDRSACSVARALELLGDRWSLLIIRETVFGTRQFDQFAAHLGIARNVLASRLARLCRYGILRQFPLRSDGQRLGYSLTPMGEELIPALVALMQWGDRWLQSPGTIPLRILARATGEELPRMQLRDGAGNVLGWRDLDWAPGPGAADPSIARLIAAYEQLRGPAPKLIPIDRASRRRERARP